MFIICILLFGFAVSVRSAEKQPNIIVVLADDVGWNDVGHHGSSQIPTPNIDALGYNGVIFHRHYSMHICTPSRSAFLTGKYPIRTGLQGMPLTAGEPRSLSPNASTLAERLSDLGYSTHLVGKWHLGQETWNVTPTCQGFKTHFGYWNGYIGYFDHFISTENMTGLDMHRNRYPSWDTKGEYATDLFTKEAVRIIDRHDKERPLFLFLAHLAGHAGKDGVDMEVPDVAETLQKYSYINDTNRRLYAEVVRRLDDSLGTVVEALYENDMLNDSLILFFSDNGAETIGPHFNSGSNWPLRGVKYTLYEGGVRSVATLWHPRLQKRGYVNENFFHICDWLPTLYAAAGGNVSALGEIDGVNQWPLLLNSISQRRNDHVLLNIDEDSKTEGIVSSDGRYKYIKGLNGKYEGYFGDSGRSDELIYNITDVIMSKVNRAISLLKNSSFVTAELIKALREKVDLGGICSKTTNDTCADGCLFDLLQDPCETFNIIVSMSELCASLKEALERFRSEALPQNNQNPDFNADPARCNGTWFPWKEVVGGCITNVSNSNNQRGESSLSYRSEYSLYLLLSLITFTYFKYY